MYKIITFLLCCFPFLATAQRADTLRIKNHGLAITQTAGFRNHKNPTVLNEVADYIHSHFVQYADSTYFQPFEVNGITYKNVVAVFGKKNLPTVVMGAHYDVCGNQEGADDNASGVMGLLELARMFKGQSLKHRLELVAYTLEEPPFFGTENMGSFHHAKSLHQAQVEVYGMVSFDMIGYFDTVKKSQNYPVGLLSWFFGSRANFIMTVNKFGKGAFARRFAKGMKKQSHIAVKRLAGPKWMEGVDWSDHLNYWKFGYSATMLTDTSFYRNANYHKKTDTMETLNFPKIAQVVDGVFETIVNLK